MTSPEAIQAELQRRSAMWDSVQSIQKERPLTADEVREIGCYNAKRATEALSTGRKGLKAAVGKDWMRDPYVEG